MQIWNTKKLIDRLRSGAITEKEKVRYYILTLLAYTGMFEFQLWSPAEGPYTKIDFAGFLVLVCTTIAGTSLALGKNTDNRDFVARVTCLTVPIAFKLILATIACAMLAYGAFEYFGNSDVDEYPIREQLCVLSLTLLFQFTFYYRLIKSIEIINHPHEGIERN